MSAPVTLMTAPIETVTAANGVRYTYRRFGRTDTSALPLVMLQHYRGNLDTWDPILVDALAQQREVVMVNNTGVGGSTGTVPSSIREMGLDIVAFTNALGLEQYDLLGFSMGGFVAQVVAMFRPHQVRRLVLAGTGPEGGANMPGMRAWSEKMVRTLTLENQDAEDFLYLFFEATDSSRAAGMEYIQRIFGREAHHDEPTDFATRDVQLTAIMEWGVPDPTRVARLAAIHQPTLVANGDNDIVVPTENSYRLGEFIPNAKVSIYPDAGHGFLDQYPAEFAAEVNAFLGH